MSFRDGGLSDTMQQQHHCTPKPIYFLQLEWHLNTFPLHQTIGTAACLKATLTCRQKATGISVMRNRQHVMTWDENRDLTWNLRLFDLFSTYVISISTRSQLASPEQVSPSCAKQQRQSSLQPCSRAFLEHV